MSRTAGISFVFGHPVERSAQTPHRAAAGTPIAGVLTDPVSYLWHSHCECANPGFVIHRKRSTVSVSIKPLEDRIVIKQVEAEQTTASGLVIPDTAKEKPQEGEVVAVGPGRIDDNGNRVPLDISVGDKVIYSKYGGTEVKYGGEDLLVLSARDVLAVVVR
jgi:chaperonin GroES